MSQPNLLWWAAFFAGNNTWKSNDHGLMNGKFFVTHSKYQCEAIGEGILSMVKHPNVHTQGTYHGSQLQDILRYLQCFQRFGQIVSGMFEFTWNSTVVTIRWKSSPWSRLSPCRPHPQEERVWWHPANPLGFINIPVSNGAIGVALFPGLPNRPALLRPSLVAS